MNPIFGLFVKAHVWLYRASGGKRGASLGRMQVVLLTTRGRKSGARRTVPLVPFVDGDQIYVMASMGGQPQHPGWYFNLEADPAVEVQRGTERWRARAEVVSPEQRASLWPRITALMPNFGAYQKRTSRVIPVVHLMREADAG